MPHGAKKGTQLISGFRDVPVSRLCALRRVTREPPMTTNYDGIAKEYQASKLQPWRTHVERHTLLRLTGDVRGLKTLDLACGEGSSTRLLRRLGADPVVGVDLSAPGIARRSSAVGRRALAWFSGAAPDRISGVRSMRLRDPS